jgi:hypothetical protein
MSTFWFTEQGGFTDVAPWAGRANPGCIAQLRPRSRALVSGTIRSARTSTVGSSPAYRAELVDGTGRLELVFLGRRRIPGLDVGCHCTIEGTVLLKGRKMTIWNPLYRIEPTEPRLAPIVPLRPGQGRPDLSGPGRATPGGTAD